MTYCQNDEMYLPYALDPTVHYPMDVEKEYDACLIGLHYDTRTMLVNSLVSRGMNVYYSIGEIYDLYREKYNRSKMALSWSSRLDIPARVFEAMGMKVPLLANYIPDMDLHFEDEKHYYSFRDINEAIVKARWILENYNDAKLVAENAYKLVLEKHTWDHRVKRILEDICYE